MWWMHDSFFGIGSMNVVCAEEISGIKAMNVVAA